MELGLSEFVKLSPFQATLAVVFGRLRVHSHDEAPPEIADRIEPSILREPAAAKGGAGAVRAVHGVPGVRREAHAFADWPQPYIADEGSALGEAAGTDATAGTDEPVVAQVTVGTDGMAEAAASTGAGESAGVDEPTAGLLSRPRARQPGAPSAPKKARIVSA